MNRRKLSAHRRYLAGNGTLKKSVDTENYERAKTCAAIESSRVHEKRIL